MDLVATEEYQQYFIHIEQKLQELYKIAKKAKQIGIDPLLKPEPKIAKDLAEMVEGLVGPPGVAKRIRELSGKISLEKTALKIAEEIVHAKFGHMEEKVALEQAIKTALAILTGGITAAPLQGISSVKIKQNLDQTRYLAIYFAGPIRSAGGTEQALILVIGDFIRRRLGLDRYKPINLEIRRFIEEIRIYEREVSRFQYHVSDKDIEIIIRNLPVEVTGIKTDNVEVVSFKNLPRIETNSVRGGALRVINDGVFGRSRKIWKIVDEFGIEGWEWLKKLEIKETQSEKPESQYMEDVIAGRPIFSFPSRMGGFRLRYGRARNTGLAALGIHPATMTILQNFLAAGTQIRIEMPGKAGIVLPVETIMPPIVKLKDGSVIRIESLSIAHSVKNNVEKILFLGDLLVGFGEFLENNKALVPSGYVEEWWTQDLLLKIKTIYQGSFKEAGKVSTIDHARLKEFVEKPFETKPTFKEALNISKLLNVPLHPCYTYLWKAIDINELLKLRSSLIKSDKTTKNGIIKIFKLPLDVKLKSILERIRLPHRISNGNIIIDANAEALAFCLKIDSKKIRIKKEKTTLETIKKLSGINFRDVGGTPIGARMGRPEKAKPRVMSPPVHALFPVSLAGGPYRNVLEAIKKGEIQVEVSRRRCPKCNAITFRRYCSMCKEKTVEEKICPKCNRVITEAVCPICNVKVVSYNLRSLNIKAIYNEACKKLGVHSIGLVKGVRGLMSETKTPEPLEKGILRANHGLFVYKDGTIRFDATDAPLTHFKPLEINTSIKQLKKLGYTHDKDGKPLQDPNQICELKVQDVILNKKCVDYLIKAAHFIDDLLQRVYELPSYYNVNNVKDIIGHLIIGLAPHTSAGIIGRIIGLTEARVCFAHPLWHNMKRRDCDGDEDTVMLALDPLINFSKAYLPAQIGGIMDTPLLIISIINPLEVDEAHNIDVTSNYPLNFYESTLINSDPKKAAQYIDTIANRLSLPAQFQGYSYTHHVTNINNGNHESAYMQLGTMSNKVASQLLLADKIEAVDVIEVAERVLTTHFIRDIVGNLRAFTTQKFRCKICNAKFRRMPLSGKCPYCKNEIVLTVHRGGIEKYLNISSYLVKKYKIRQYYKQRIDLVKDEIDLLFRSREKQIHISDFM